jgi:predicted peroxiredoxin
MPGRVVIFIQTASYEAAYQAASVGITATAMGDEVYFVFAFDALRKLLQGAFGKPQTEKETADSARAEGLGLPPPLHMLEEARSLGARLVACDTTLKICGFSPSEIGNALDEVIGLPSIWRLTQGAHVLSL